MPYEKKLYFKESLKRHQSKLQQTENNWKYASFFLSVGIVTGSPQLSYVAQICKISMAARVSFP